MKFVVREMIMVIILKQFFCLFFNDGFHFAAELDKPDDFERS